MRSQAGQGSWPKGRGYPVGSFLLVLTHQEDAGPVPSAPPPSCPGDLWGFGLGPLGSVQPDAEP